MRLTSARATKACVVREKKFPYGTIDKRSDRALSTPAPLHQSHAKGEGQAPLSNAVTSTLPNLPAASISTLRPAVKTLFPARRLVRATTQTFTSPSVRPNSSVLVVHISWQRTKAKRKGNCGEQLMVVYQPNPHAVVSPKVRTQFSSRVGRRRMRCLAKCWKPGPRGLLVLRGGGLGGLARRASPS